MVPQKTHWARRAGGLATTVAIPAAVYTAARFGTKLIPSAALRVVADAGVIILAATGGHYLGNLAAGGVNNVKLDVEVVTSEDANTALQEGKKQDPRQAAVGG